MSTAWRRLVWRAHTDNTSGDRKVLCHLADRERRSVVSMGLEERGCGRLPGPAGPAGVSTATTIADGRLGDPALVARPTVLPGSTPFRGGGAALRGAHVGEAETALVRCSERRSGYDQIFRGSLTHVAGAATETPAAVGAVVALDATAREDAVAADMLWKVVVGGAIGAGGSVCKRRVQRRWTAASRILLTDGTGGR